MLSSCMFGEYSELHSLRESRLSLCWEEPCFLRLPQPALAGAEAPKRQTQPDHYSVQNPTASSQALEGNGIMDTTLKTTTSDTRSVSLLTFLKNTQLLQHWCLPIPRVSHSCCGGKARSRATCNTDVRVRYTTHTQPRQQEEAPCACVCVLHIARPLRAISCTHLVFLTG